MGRKTRNRLNNSDYDSDYCSNNDSDEDNLNEEENINQWNDLVNDKWKNIILIHEKYEKLEELLKHYCPSKIISKLNQIMYNTIDYCKILYKYKNSYIHLDNYLNEILNILVNNNKIYIEGGKDFYFYYNYEDLFNYLWSCMISDIKRNNITVNIKRCNINIPLDIE